MTEWECDKSDYNDKHDERCKHVEHSLPWTDYRGGRLKGRKGLLTEG